MASPGGGIPAGFRKAVTSLAQLEEKLRRNLGLAGAIGAVFEPKLTPVIIAADLREAGNASNQGRAFAWVSDVVGVLNLQSLRFEQDSFVDRFDISVMNNNGSGAGRAAIYLTVPGQAPAVAVSALAGTWTDRKTIAGDQVPLTQSALGAITGTAVSDQNRLWGAVTASAALGVYGYFSVKANVMLPAGSALNFVSTQAGSQFVTVVSGRIWP